MTQDLQWIVNSKSWKWLLVKRWAGVNKSDGCTGVPDCHIECCWLHDKYYRDGTDFSGQPISRRDADYCLRICIQSRSKLGYFSPLSWIRWVGVRLFGRRFYKGT